MKRETSVLTIAVATYLGGCETVGQDIKDISAAIKPTTPSEAARMMVDPHNSDNRREGTVLIANATFGGTEAYLKNYRDMVDNERDPIVKAVAIRALARHGEPADAMRILPHLTNENVQVRWEAAKGLQRLHNPAAIPELLKTLLKENETSDVRFAAAVALGQYAEDRVFHGLVAALDVRELTVNAAAEQSLHTMTGQSFGMDSLQWLKWHSGVAGSADAFAGRTDYLYPTYGRDDTIWEKIAFWTHRNFEKPGLPAGLRPPSERSTYGDESGGS